MINIKKIKLIALLFFLNFILFSFSNSVLAQFQNYFTELGSPKLDSTTLSPAEEQVEQALAAILRRLQIYHIEGVQPDGSPHIVTHHFFDKIQEIVQKHDPTAKAYVSGGVVRSLLGYIYQEIYLGHQQTPSKTTEQILKEIIENKTEISTLSALGIASDLDVEIETSQDHAPDPALLSEVEKFIESTVMAMNPESGNSDLDNTLALKADVQDYRKQTANSILQGGSAIDWLAFPISERSGHHMRLPEHHSNIFKKFLTGEYDYFSPSAGSKLQDKQSIRGLRPLLEIPFLKLSADGEKQLLSELETLLAQVKKGEQLSSKALLQFKKLSRNARMEGGHNRFYQAHEKIGNLVLQISDELRLKDSKNKSLIPEFLINNNINTRSPKKTSIDDLLMPVDEFIKDYTDNGHLYHGTDTPTVLTIIRNGFCASSDKSGMASCGRGAYTTPKKFVASDYGTPIPIQLKENSHPRILDWPKVSQNPLILEIVNQARTNKIDPFEILAEKYDIDIIVNTHVLIENSGAIELPKNIPDLIHIYEARAEDTASKLADSTLLKDTSRVRPLEFSDIRAYKNIYTIGKKLGLSLKKPPEIEPIVLKISGFLDDPDPHVRASAALLLSKSKLEDPTLLHKLAKRLTDKDLKVRYYAAKCFLNFSVIDPKYQLTLIEAMADPQNTYEDPEDPNPGMGKNIRSAAYYSIYNKLNPDDSELQKALSRCLHGDGTVTFYALEQFKYKFPPNLSSQLEIVKLLADTNPGTQQYAASILEQTPHKSDELLIALIKALENDQSRDPAYSILQKYALSLEDPTHLVSSKLLDELIAHLKSTIPDVRLKAQELLSALLPSNLKKKMTCINDLHVVPVTQKQLQELKLLLKITPEEPIPDQDGDRWYDTLEEQ